MTPNLRQLISGLALGLGVIALPLAVVAATVPPTTTPANSAVSADRITTLKAKADTEITRRLTALNAALTRLNQLKNLTAADKTTLTTQIQTEITSLTALKTKIAADTDIATLRTDVKSIMTEYRVFALVLPKARFVAVADAELAAVDRLTTLANDLQTRITAVQTAGHDVASLTATLTDMQKQIADAKTKASGVESSVIGLQPTDYNNDHTIMGGKLSTLQQARTDLQTARQDAETIRAGLNQLKTTSNNSANSGTSNKNTTSQ